MSDIIHLLPDTVANQIAAGEVIQRPASIIKELCENAVDAGSTNISVVVKDGGKTSIEIIDDGCGMSPTDARMSFERHATSKIHEANDLFAIRTFGFRGEALASVASVSQVVLKTRLHDDDTGTELVISGSKVESQEMVACSAGSHFTIKNLFYNVPARRKFLKSTSAEFRHILYEFQRIALANKDLSFSLTHNDTEIYNLPSGSLKQRIIHLFGKNMNNSLTNIETTTSLVKINGFIGKPEHARKTPGEQFFFINYRFMRHPYFNKAVLTAYEKILPPETLPSYFIFLEADPSAIDINIHPSKTEIKFENETAIFQIITAAVREALGKFNIMPSIDFNRESAIEFPLSSGNINPKIPDIPYNPQYNPFEQEYKGNNSNFNYSIHGNENIKNWERLFNNDASESTMLSHNNQQADDQQSININSGYSGHVFLQIKYRYIITSVKSGLMLIDQKRAHERILFEDYIKSLAMNQPMAQHTLFPETFDLNPADCTLFQEILDDLRIIGFDINNFGGNTFVINAYPESSSYKGGKALIDHFMELYKSNLTDIKINARENIARSMAMANSINYGEKLEHESMQHIIDKLFACENPNYSPSGKPVISLITLEELENKLK